MSIVFAAARDASGCESIRGDSRDSDRRRVVDDAIPRSCPKKIFVPVGRRIRRDSVVMSAAHAHHGPYHTVVVARAPRMQEVRNSQGFLASLKDRR